MYLLQLSIYLRTQDTVLRTGRTSLLVLGYSRTGMESYNGSCSVEMSRAWEMTQGKEKNKVKLLHHTVLEHYFNQK